jgi:hypothetical protein
LGNVSLNSRNVGADGLHGLVELLLAAARDEDIGTLIDEKLCGSQPNPFRAAGDDSDLTFELFSHCFPLFVPVPTNFSPSDSFVLWESSSEHGSATIRLLFRGLILNDIPMLGEYAVLDTQDIRGNPIYRSTETAKSPVHDHEVPLSHDRS